MSEIKTWNQRCEEHPDHQEGIISREMICARMQEEIDELRGALHDQRLLTKLNSNERLRQTLIARTMDDTTKERDELRSKLEWLEQQKPVGRYKETHGVDGITHWRKLDIEWAPDFFAQGGDALFLAAGAVEQPAPEIEQLRKDAERYRWLRHEVGDIGSLYVGIDSHAYPNRWALTGEEADSAIDDATTKEGQKP